MPGRGRARGAVPQNNDNWETQDYCFLNDTLLQLEILSRSVTKKTFEGSGESTSMEKLKDYIESSLEGQVHNVNSQIMTQIQLKEYIEGICNRCCADPIVIRTAIIFLNRIQHLKVGDVSARALVLKKLQSTFTDRDNMMKQDKGAFLTSAMFLCEGYAFMTLQGTRIEVMRAPVLAFLETFLNENDVRFADAFRTEFLLNKRYLQEADQQSVDNLLELLRKKIIADSTPAPVRKILLNSLELHLVNGSLLAENVSQFYGAD